MAGGLETILLGSYGWYGNLVPIILALLISFAIVRKVVEMAYIQFPICVGLKIIFPGFSYSILIISAAIVLLGLLLSKDDMISDIKNNYKKIRE